MTPFSQSGINKQKKQINKMHIWILSPLKESQYGVVSRGNKENQGGKGTCCNKI